MFARLQAVVLHACELVIILAAVYFAIHWLNVQIPEELSAVILAAILKLIREMTFDWVNQG